MTFIHTIARLDMEAEQSKLDSESNPGFVYCHYFRKHSNAQEARQQLFSILHGSSILFSVSIYFTVGTADPISILIPTATQGTS
jgi:hypothetical protein